MDDTQIVSHVIRREPAVAGGFIYLVKLRPSNSTTYLRWASLPASVQHAYLVKHPHALQEEQGSHFVAPTTLKGSRKRGPKRRYRQLSAARDLELQECYR